ncbi:MAG: 7-cyano-7-deazaguanine synthase QueC [Alicyclobacillaceae bacterium]|jgi:7-cyano-7-deazaguanine synthase|nr:7-cyano-7-deazaguanine synthase QueC [Alicyclobacillaceae bacterium]
MNDETKGRAVVILSGGLDSATCLGIADSLGYGVDALTFDYGQRHRREIDSANALAEHYNVRNHRVVPLDFLHVIGGSALTEADWSVPREGVNAQAIPSTYVPGRNLLFLALAASYAEVIGAHAIFIGVNALDYSGYPDCRPEFIDAVSRVFQVGTKMGVEGVAPRLETPLLSLTKAQIIQWGTSLGVPYELTTSCYEGGAVACGVCDSCRLRLYGFAEAGLTDPIPYQSSHSDL